MKYYTKDVIGACVNLEPLHCYFCDSKEVTFNQYIGDSHCGNCGEWQMTEVNN